MFYSIICVPPVKFRPVSVVNGLKYDNAVSAKLGDILSASVHLSTLLQVALHLHDLDIISVISLQRHNTQQWSCGLYINLDSKIEVQYKFQFCAIMGNLSVCFAFCSECCMFNWLILIFNSFAGTEVSGPPVSHLWSRREVPEDPSGVVEVSDRGQPVCCHAEKCPREEARTFPNAHDG